MDIIKSGCLSGGWSLCEWNPHSSTYLSLSLKIISGEGKSEELKDLIKNCHRLINQSSDVSKR